MPDLPNLDGQIEAIGPIRPGDTVLIRVSPTYSQQEFHQANEMLRDYFASRLPDVQFAVVACEDIRVYRPA